MSDWFETFHETLWLKGDDTGADEAQFLWQALQLQPGARALDAPCGAGRVALHLARAGCRLTGIDRHPAFLARARRRFADAGLSGDFQVMDLRALDSRGEFDAIYNWQGSFGYCSDAENADVLRRMAGAVKPGGRVLIDQPNREWLLRHFQAEMELPGGRNENRWIPAMQRVETIWHRAGIDTPSISTMRLYTPSQFRRLFARAGLTWETAYGGKDGSPCTRGSRRLIVIGRK